MTCQIMKRSASAGLVKLPTANYSTHGNNFPKSSIYISTIGKERSDSGQKIFEICYEPRTSLIILAS